MSGKFHTYWGIHINASVTTELTWLASVIPCSIGVRLIDAGLWGLEDADFVVWTDASLWHGLAFAFAGNGFYYQLWECPSNVLIDIFFLELVAILSAIHYVASLPHPPCRLVVFTDSLDAVGVFNSLWTSMAIHNGPLLAVAGIIMELGVDLRVLHIEGKVNLRADLLSHLLLSEYALKFPSDCVCSFSPPWDLFPVRWRECF